MSEEKYIFRQISFLTNKYMKKTQARLLRLACVPFINP